MTSEGMAKPRLIDINNAADYICFSMFEADGQISVLKLHKLLYYVQAWHLALFGSRLFNEEFQAWVHGPVSRAIYDRFKSDKMMFSPILLEDIKQDFSGITRHAITHIDNVLEKYAPLSATQLESLSHEEEPWKKARKGLPPFARCETPIDDELMKKFYRRKMNS